MDRGTMINDILDSVGDLKAVLSLLYAVNVEAISPDTLERISLLSIDLLETIEKRIKQIQ